MWKIRIILTIFLILALVSVSGAQTAPAAPPTSGPDIVTSLGKMTLEQVKKNAPGGTETQVQNLPGSPLE